MKEELKYKIFNSYGFFVSHRKVKRPDFYIDFIDGLNFDIVSKDSSNKLYALFFEEKEPNRIETYNQINIYQFQFILKYVMNKLLIYKGFMIHSSAVNINGNVILFLGKPGAGKSTAARLLWKNYLTLADDSSIIKKGGDGSFCFYQTPFIEKDMWIVKRNNKFSLGKIYFLRKAKYFKIQKIHNKEYVLKKLTEQIFSVEKYLDQQMKTLFQFVADFNEFYVLYFAKDEKGMIELFENLDKS